MDFVRKLRAWFSPTTDHKDMGMAIFILRVSIGGIDEELDVIPKSIRRAFR